jgi:DNA-binding FadR family transcriptional regulator
MAIAAELRRRIAVGEFALGDPLPPEGDLTTALGYSKPVIREALRILETEGLIEVKRGQGGGARVQRPSISHATKPIGTYLQIGDVQVMDVWAARDRIVAAAVERAAGAAVVDLRPLVAEVDELVAAIGEVSTYYLNILNTSEAAVAIAGSVTDHVVVVALRHVVEAELAAATAAANELDAAIEAERNIAEGWTTTLHHIRGRRPQAARAAFETNALALQARLAETVEGVTVRDFVALSPMERALRHSRITVAGTSNDEGRRHGR